MANDRSRNMMKSVRWIALSFASVLPPLLVAAGWTPASAATSIVAADGRLLFAVDATTGMRTILSDFANATQGPIGSSFRVGTGPGGTIYATDGATDEKGKLFEIFSDGTRIVRSDATVAAQGNPWHTPDSVAVDSDGSLLVSDRGFGGGGNAAGLWRVDASSGARVKLADFGGAPEGIALGASDEILLGDASGGTDCHTFGGCGALYRVDRVSGALTTLGDFGNPAQGPLGEDAGHALARDTDDTILVVDPFAPPGSAGCFDTGGCGVLFRWDPVAGMHSLVTKYADATQGAVGGFRPKGVAIATDGTIFVSPCPGSNGRGAICTVDRVTGARTTLSDLGDSAQGPLGSGPSSIALVELGATTTSTTPTTTTTTLASDGPCPMSPAEGCRAPAVARKGLFELRRGRKTATNLLRWRWQFGAATTLADFGDPLADTAYQLCVYDAAGLRMALGVAPGGTCARHPCWTAGTKSFRYRNRVTTATPVTDVILRAGAVRKATATFAARGSPLLVPSLPLALPATVQLRASTGVCWSTIHSSAGLSTSKVLRSRSD